MQILIYGATGYTGRRISRALRGRRPVLGGRDARRLGILADALDLDARVADLEDSSALSAALRDVDLVVNAAGPFRRTAPPLVRACLRTATHYLDLSGEIDVFEALSRLDPVARRAGVLLLPGAGNVVVPTDCLALHLRDRLPGARELSLALSRLEMSSRGSMRTASGLLRREVRVRRGGRLVSTPAGALTRHFDFGAGRRQAMAVTWADLSSAYFTTGIADLTVFVEAGPLGRSAYTVAGGLAWWLNQPVVQRLVHRGLAWWPEAPPTAVLARQRRVAVGEARDASGRGVRGRLVTPDPYRVTVSAVVALRRAIETRPIRTGYCTPAGLFGAELLQQLPQAELFDLV